MEEQDSHMPGLHKNEMEIIESETNVIEMINVNASWTNDCRYKTLVDLNIQIKSGKLYAIIGSVASGKSSIFQILLGELPIYSGDVLINGDLSYASQDPWLFSSTVRNNILFGLPFDKIRYQQTVKHCALLTDFQQLPLGDKTLVGERGCALSGGQRARVNLARAVYRNASIYLLDDVLSAVDTHVGKYLFDECLGPRGYLAKQKATRILITHQVHFLKEADWIIVVDKGKILRQGTWNEVMDIDLLQYVSTQSEGSDDEKLNSISQEKSKMSRMNDDDIPYIDDDGDNVPGSHRGYLKLKTSESKKSLSIASSLNDLDATAEQYNENKNEEKILFWKVFYEYFRAGATLPILLFLILFLIFSQFMTSACDYFLKIFTNQELLRLHNEETFFTTKEGLYIYGFLILAVVIVTLSRGFMFFAICMRSSKKIHDKSFLCLLHSPMNFFDLNQTGRILNRFSKDMGAVDELLPKAIIEATQVNKVYFLYCDIILCHKYKLQNLLVMIGILVLISLTMTGHGYFFVTTLGVAIILYIFIVKIYLRTAGDLKQLEGISE